MSERYRPGEEEKRGVFSRMMGMFLIVLATVSGSKDWKEKLKKKYNRK